MRPSDEASETGNGPAIESFTLSLLFCFRNDLECIDCDPGLELQIAVRFCFDRLDPFETLTENQPKALEHQLQDLGGIISKIISKIIGKSFDRLNSTWSLLCGLSTVIAPDLVPGLSPALVPTALSLIRDAN